MRRHLLFALLIASLSQLSTGCHILRNTVWRLRHCGGCAPAFHGPVCDTPMYGGVGYGYGAADCSSCTSGYPAGYMVMPGSPLTPGTVPPPNVEQMPAGGAKK